jgi:hypothetical protein
MKTLNDYKCEHCDAIYEKFTNALFLLCDCGGTMHKVMCAPTVRLEGITGSFPGAADKWAKIREDKHRIDSKRNS